MANEYKSLASLLCSNKDFLNSKIQNDVEYVTAVHRINLYMKYSADIYGIYLKYVSKDDIHMYSIDEDFLNITPFYRYMQIR